MIILKNRLEFLTKENSELKNKITVVNDFISSYKSSDGIIDSKKNKLLFKILYIV